MVKVKAAIRTQLADNVEIMDGVEEEEEEVEVVVKPKAKSRSKATSKVASKSKAVEEPQAEESVKKTKKPKTPVEKTKEIIDFTKVKYLVGNDHLDRTFNYGSCSISIDDGSFIPASTEYFVKFPEHVHKAPPKSKEDQAPIRIQVEFPLSLTENGDWKDKKTYDIALQVVDEQRVVALKTIISSIVTQLKKIQNPPKPSKTAKPPKTPKVGVELRDFSYTGFKTDCSVIRLTE